jgi:hypothetical protein
MRETRLYGSEGGGTEINRSFLPLFDLRPSGAKRLVGCALPFPGARCPWLLSCAPPGQEG